LPQVQSDYFLDRRRRAAAGEELESLSCPDSSTWSDQLHREQLADTNAERDREAGLVA